jgi:hypothetical protein
MYGGGIFKAEGAIVNVRNTIIASNTAPFGSDINGYSNGQVEPYRPVFNSLGNNLIGINTDGFNAASGFVNSVGGDRTGTIDVPLDPLLSPFANYGGNTDTHTLLPGSPAANAGNNCVVTATCLSNNAAQPLTADQRGNGFPVW